MDTNAGANRRKGIALTASGVVILSPNGMLVEAMSADIWAIIFWRSLMMAAALVLYLLFRYGRGVVDVLRASGGPAALAAGMLLASALVLFVVAVKLSTVANALFILSSAPLFAAVFSRVLLGERATASTWISAAVAVLGMGIIVADGLEFGFLLGNLAALGVAMSFGGALTALRYGRLQDGVPAMAIGGIVATIVSFPMASSLAIAGSDIWLAGLLGLVVMPVSFGLISHGPKYITAPEVGLITLLEAVLGSLWAWLVMAQIPSPHVLLGGAIIVGTLAVHFAVTSRSIKPNSAAGSPT